MKTTTTVALMVVRAAGTATLILGLIFWSGYAASLTTVHILLGLLVVLGLWTLAFTGARAGTHRGLVALSAAWGVVVPVLGMTQRGLLPGELHWLVEIAHLVIGIVALGLAEMLGGETKRARASVAQSA